MVVRHTGLGFAVALVLVCLATASALAQQPASDNLKAQRRQITELYKAGNYSEAFALQRTFVARVEVAETAEDGRPGPKTADALGNLAWYALTARDFPGALAASERARALAVGQTWIETNRAHALVFLGRLEEARQIYRAHRGARLASETSRTWEDMLADDFEELRKRGLTHAAFDEIATELGLNKHHPADQGARPKGPLDHCRGAPTYNPSCELSSNHGLAYATGPSTGLRAGMEGAARFLLS